MSGVRLVEIGRRRRAGRLDVARRHFSDRVDEENVGPRGHRRDDARASLVGGFRVQIDREPVRADGTRVRPGASQVRVAVNDDPRRRRVVRRFQLGSQLGDFDAVRRAAAHDPNPRPRRDDGVRRSGSSRGEPKPVGRRGQRPPGARSRRTRQNHALAADRKPVDLDGDDRPRDRERDRDAPHLRVRSVRVF